MAELTPEQLKSLQALANMSGQSEVSPGQMSALSELQALFQQPEPDTQRIRSMLQGLTFSSADEAEAYLTSLFTGRPYSESVADVRQKLSAYREARPGEAFAYEAAGGTIPAILATLGTGGTGAPAAYPNLARAGRLLFAGPSRQSTLARNVGAQSAYGLGQGTLAGIGAGEGTMTDRLQSGGAGGVFGTLIGGGTSLAGRVLSGPAETFSNFLRNRLAGRGSTAAVEEFRRLVAQAFPGKTYDQLTEREINQFITDIAEGRIAAENPAITESARAFNVGGAGEVLRQGMEARPERARDAAMEFLIDEMAPNLKGSNVIRFFNMSDDELRSSASSAYENAFAQYGDIGPMFLNEIQAILEFTPAMRRKMLEIYESTRNVDPFFRVDRDGTVRMLRMPTLRDAEFVRRGMSELADYSFERGSSQAASGYRQQEAALRNMLDQNFPELTTVRREWAGIEAATDAFKEARRATSATGGIEGDVFEDLWLNTQRRAEEYGPEVLDAFRMGMLTKIKAGMESPRTRPVIFRNMNDETSRLGKNLRLVFPGESADELFRRVDLATSSQEATQRIFGGSQTARTTAEASRQGLGVSGGDVLDTIMGQPSAMMRVAGSLTRRALASTGLSNQQQEEVARLLVETNPDVVKRALLDNQVADQAIQLIQRLAGATTSGITTGTGRAAAATAGGNLEMLPGLLGQ